MTPHEQGAVPEEARAQGNENHDALSDASEKAAKRFLRSVVLIDNEAYMGQVGEEKDHDIDAARVTAAFSDEKISCAVFRPVGLNVEQIAETGVNLVQRTDAAILDWQLGGNEHEDRSEACKAILKGVLEEDTKAGNPLRLIVIYTGDKVTNELLSLIQPVLDGYGFTSDKENSLFRKDNMRILVRQKQAAKPEVIEGLEPETEIAPDKLPELVVTEFSKLANGLLSSAALHAVSAVRENAASLLGVFHNGLDPAFILHAILIPNFRDAHEFLVNLIADECRVLIENDQGLSDLIDKDWVRQWLQKRFRENYPLSCDYCGGTGHREEGVGCPYCEGEGNRPVSSDELSALLDQENAQLDKIPDQSLLRLIYKDKGHDGDGLSFGRLVSLGNEAYSSKRKFICPANPVLTQGTLISLYENDDLPKNFYLCVMPRCDAERVAKKQYFPFISLHKAENWKEASLTINCMVRGEAEIEFKSVYLKFPKQVSWKKLKIIQFKGNKSSPIMATKEKGRYIFESLGKNGKDNLRYEWLGTLRSDLTSKLVSELLPGLSRIGIDEFEWQRRIKENSR